MAPVPAPAQMTPRTDDPTNGSSFKNRAASSPDLEPLQETERYVFAWGLREL